MNDKQNSNFDALVIGFALFAMFFGAGNLIFPPALAVNAGSSWFSGFMSFFIADAGLAMVGVFALMQCNGNLSTITRVIGKTPGKILIVAVILCIGPFLAIPRTATVTFSLGVVPILGLEGDTKIALAIFSLLYFGVTLLLSIKPSKVVDIIGKVLTPVLVTCALLLIILGVTSPKADVLSYEGLNEKRIEAVQLQMQTNVNKLYKDKKEVKLSEKDFEVIRDQEKKITTVKLKGFEDLGDKIRRVEKIGHVSLPSIIKGGIIEGYQTMDAMASLLFASIVITSIYAKGYKKGRVANSVATKSVLVAGALLFIIYGGLAYLGATTGSTHVVEYNAEMYDKAQFMTLIVRDLMGYVGTIVMGLVVFMACLTTSIGLTTTAGNYFETATNGKLKYTVTVFTIIIASTLLSNLGLNLILKMAVPVLLLVYPMVILLIIMAFLQNRILKKMPYTLSGILTFIISLMTVANSSFGVEAFDFINKLPLNDFGLNWIVPAIIAFVVGLFIPSGKFEAIKIEE